MRRKNDKTQFRLMLGLAVLTVLSSVLSSIIGYKAIRAIDAFAELMGTVSRASRKSLVPDGY